MAGKEMALRELLLYLAEHPELVETIVLKPNKVIRQGKRQDQKS